MAHSRNHPVSARGAHLGSNLPRCLPVRGSWVAHPQAKSASVVNLENLRQDRQPGQNRAPILVVLLVKFGDELSDKRPVPCRQSPAVAQMEAIRAATGGPSIVMPHRCRQREPKISPGARIEHSPIPPAGQSPGCLADRKAFLNSGGNRHADRLQKLRPLDLPVGNRRCFMDS